MRPLLAYVRERSRRDRELRLWRSYVAESVRLAASGRAMRDTYDDMLAGLDAPRGWGFDPDEVARSVVERGGLVVT